MWRCDHDHPKALSWCVQPVAPVPVSAGLVWTTDAPSRETMEQVNRHAEAGGLAVAMQAASLFAFGAARKSRLAS